VSAIAVQLVIPPGYAQFSFFVTNATVGHRCVWSIGGKLNGSGLAPTQGALLFTHVSDALKPLWDSQVVQTGFHALIGNDGPPFALDVTGSVPGTASTGTMLPPNVTMLFKKGTLFAGRAYRGRAYLPFVEGTYVNEAGVIQSTLLTKMVTAAAALLAAPSTSSLTGVDNWALLHRAEEGATAPPPTSIMTIQATDRVATQRRRLER
jgi:hypothetical protein